MKIILLLTIALLSSCSTISNSSSSSLVDEDFNISINTIYSDQSSPTTHSSLKVKLGEDITDKFMMTSLNKDSYLLGIYKNNTENLINAKALRSFDNSFSSITIVRCKKENAANYLTKYNGTYLNARNDTLVVNNTNITWNFKVNDMHIITFNCDISNKTNSLSPYTTSFTANEDVIEAEQGVFSFEIANYEGYLDDSTPSYKPNLLMSSIRPTFTPLYNYIRDYCSGKSIPFSQNDYLNLSSYLCYFRNNEVTINYDIE